MSARGRPRSFDRTVALDGAVRLFWEHGFDGASVRDLSEALGIGAPSLYAAFGDKQALFTEAVADYDARYGNFFDLALAEEPTARRAVERVFALAPAQYTRRGLPRGCLVVQGDAGTDDPGVRAHLNTLRRSKVRALRAKIAVDVAGARLPADTDPETLALYTMTVLGGLADAARDRIPRAALTRVAALALTAWPAETRPAPEPAA